MASHDDWIYPFQSSSLKGNSLSPTTSSGLTVISAGSSLPTISSALVGQSSSTTSLVSPGEYGGVAKRVHLFSFDPALPLCLGYVAQEFFRGRMASALHYVIVHYYIRISLY